MTSPRTFARWEQRATARVLEARGAQILERSRQIVAAGFELLQREGLDALTIRAVLKKTGLSRRAFYERFADKDELMLAIFEETIRRAAQHYGEKILSLSSPLDRLRLIVTSMVLGSGSSADGGTRRNRRWSVAMVREHLRLAESRPDELQATLSPLIELLAQQLADGMEAGLVRRCSPERLAMFVYNLVATTVHTEMLSAKAATDHEQRAQLAADVWEFCRRAIVA